MSVQTEVSLQKLPPQNIDAEQMVLGAILIENDSINKVVDLLSPDDFYKDSHRRIFQSCSICSSPGGHRPGHAERRICAERRRWKRSAARRIWRTLVSLVPTAANIKYHARIVREKSVLRKLIHSSTDIITQCYDDSRTVDSIDELLNTAERVHLRYRPEADRQALLLAEGYRRPQFRDGRKALRTEGNGHRPPDGFCGPGQHDVGAPAERPHHHRRPSLHGKDRVRSEHRRPCGDRKRKDRGCLQSGNGQGAAGAADARLRGAGGRP